MLAERTAHHQRLPVTWVLVANGQTAQIYSCGKTGKAIPLNISHKHPAYDERSGHELVPVPNGAVQGETIDDYQIGHSRRGTSISSVSAARNTYEPHGDIKEELRRRFVKDIAARLEKAHTQKKFHRLVLVAPAKMIGELREHLTPGVQGCVAAVLPKDLATYDARALLPHLQDTLAEAHVA